MRRKAQAMSVEPARSNLAGEEILSDLANLLQSGPAPVQMDAPPMESVEAVPVEEVMEGPLGFATEALEQAATDKVECGIMCLEKAIDLFAEYEEMEDGGEISGEGDKKENEAIDKIDSLISDMKEALDELKAAEVQEHEEKMAEASAEEDTEEEDEDESEDDQQEEAEQEKEAGLKGFTRKANKKKVSKRKASKKGTPFVDLDFQF